MKSGIWTAHCRHSHYNVANTDHHELIYMPQTQSQSHNVNSKAILVPTIIYDKQQPITITWPFLIILWTFVVKIVCRGCMNPVTGAGCTSVDIGVKANLELVHKFWCLGDMLSVDGDADAAAENRIRTGWNKFRQLVPLLTNMDISLKVRGRLCSSCVRSSMLDGSETWSVRKKNEAALQQTEKRMVTWMCGVKPQDRIWSKGLRERPGLDDIILVLKQNRLRWYGHLLRKEDNDWVKKCMEYEVEGGRPRGRPKKTWRKTFRRVDWTGRIAVDGWSR